MENCHSLDEVCAHYRDRDNRDPKWDSHRTMQQLLGKVVDDLRSKRLVYGISHERLFIERYVDGMPDTFELRFDAPRWMYHLPRIAINAVGGYVDVRYEELWDDGPFQRQRIETIHCPIKNARPALLEMVARLKAEENLNPNT